MNVTEAPGLTAGWLNAWLAAIGITVLVPGARLGWSQGPRPHARIHHDGPDLADQMSAGFPSHEALVRLAIAVEHPDAGSAFPRRVTLEGYEDRARLARSTGDASLAMSVTDLAEGEGGVLRHSPFDVSVPQGRTLWNRVVDCRALLPAAPGQEIAATLTGRGRRVQNNGLGFDHTRFLSPADPHGQVWVDPVIEVLAFAGMSLFPLRGDGRRLSPRGWTDRATRPGALAWPAWPQPLDAAGVDALLDAFWAGDRARTAVIVFESVPYQPRAAADVTRGYASRELG